MPVRGEDHGLAEPVCRRPASAIAASARLATWELGGVIPGTGAAYHVLGFARGGAQVRGLYE